MVITKEIRQGRNIVESQDSNKDAIPSPPLQDIPIYAKTIKELRGRKPIRKIKNSSSTVHVVGALSDLILGREKPVKYVDPGNPIVTVQIQGCSFPNTLVDLGAAINILTMETCNALGLHSFNPTSIMLQ